MSCMSLVAPSKRWVNSWIFQKQTKTSLVYANASYPSRFSFLRVVCLCLAKVGFPPDLSSHWFHIDVDTTASGMGNHTLNRRSGIVVFWCTVRACLHQRAFSSMCLGKKTRQLFGSIWAIYQCLPWPLWIWGFWISGKCIALRARWRKCWHQWRLCVLLRSSLHIALDFLMLQTLFLPSLGLCT